MHPTFKSFFSIAWYSVFSLLGFFTSYLLAKWRGKYLRVERRHFDNLALILVIIGYAGAVFLGRLFYEHLSFWDSLEVWRGGAKVFYGGAVIGILAVILYSLVMHVPLLKLGDILGASVPLGLMFGRIGCFMAGCCWGDVCIDSDKLNSVTDSSFIYQIHTLPVVSKSNFPLSVTFPKNSLAFKQHVSLGLLQADKEQSLPVHPVQLYEAVLALLLCILLNKCFKYRKRDGEIFFVSILSYAAIRFWLEFLRAGNPPIYLGMTISQVISIALALISISFFSLRWYKFRKVN